MCYKERGRDGCWALLRAEVRDITCCVNLMQGFEVALEN